ncbi:MAG: DUF4097 domain-containing protein [Pseudonocardia sp.]|nr:DUF4097 domain-containing protein [Pseudonocardia sp.]
MTDFTKDQPQDDGPTESGRPDRPVVRQQSWECPGAAEIEIAIDIGRVRVDLVETPAEGAGAGEVHVEVRHDPETGGGFAQGVRGLMNWVSNASTNWTGGVGFGGWERSGDQGFDSGSWDAGSWDSDRFAAEAVRAAEISWSEAGRRLVVRSAPDMPLRIVPLAVTVRAPAGSRLAARTGAGGVTVAGRAGWAALRTGSGRVVAGDVDGDLDVNAGSGDVTVGAVRGRSRVRTGTGDISVAATGGPMDVKAGSGQVQIGRLDGDLGARTGSGDVRVIDAVSGSCDVTTGSGDVIISVHPGVVAEVDLSSGSGTARSDLVVNAMPPARSPALRLRGRTGSGDVLVTRAHPAPEGAPA